VPTTLARQKALDRREPLTDGAFGQTLQMRVERRVHVNGLVRQSGRLVGDGLQDVVDEVRRFRLQRPPDRMERLAGGAGGGLAREMTRLDHRRQDHVPALTTALG